MTLVLGTEVVVGRVGTIAVASAAVSRQHVAIARRGDDVVVRDLGSRNGTLLRGLALAGEAIVSEAIEVRLGKEVPLVVRPRDRVCPARSSWRSGACTTSPRSAPRDSGWAPGGSNAATTAGWSS